MGGQRSEAEATAAGDAFRERIVQASIELIEEQGLGALSMREVARRAGVSHQAPYYHFQDREAILGAIAEQGFRMLRDQVAAAMPAARGGAPQASIMAAGEAYIRFAFTHPSYFRVMFRRELVTPERHPNMKAEGDRACATRDQDYRARLDRGKTDRVHSRHCGDPQARPGLKSDFFRKRHGLRGRQHDEFGCRAECTFPLPIPQPHPLADT